MRRTKIDSVHPYLEEGDQVRAGGLAKHEALSKALGFMSAVGLLTSTFAAAPITRVPRTNTHHVGKQQRSNPKGLLQHPQL